MKHLPMNVTNLLTESIVQTLQVHHMNSPLRLVMEGKSGGYYVFVVPIEKEVDRKAAAKAVGEKAVDMIHVKDITKITGYVRGGCSPIGMKKPFPTVFDASAGNFQEIYVSGGRIGLTLKVPVADLLKVTGGKLAAITAEE